MEKGPKVRIVGGASTEKKEQAKKELRQALFNHSNSLSLQEREALEKFEYPKSLKELALINFVNQETSRLMQEAGIKPYDIPFENYHIIPPELYHQLTKDNSNAATENKKQAMIFNAEYFRDNPVNFGAVALHETLHLKAHLSMEVEEKDGKVDSTLYRESVAIRAAQSKSHHGEYHHHFTGLHEGIVAETEKRLLAKLLDLPQLAKEKEWLESDEAREMRKNLAQEKEIPEDDIIWIGKKGENDLEWELVTYPQQRKVLNYLCVEIQKQFPDQYRSADDVYQTFLNAHFTGRLLPIARLIEKTFGEGSFRLLGNMGTGNSSGVLHLESLKKARARQIR
ncbi:MAG: hypothetical protein V4699_02695 [Patescibacteria group bacterium]